MINKKYIMFGLPILALMLVSAGVYYVSTLTVQSKVLEPFSIQYALIGDGGNYNGIDTCECIDTDTCESTGITPFWFESDGSLMTDEPGLFAGEGRMICAKITNEAEAIIPYQIKSEILNTEEEGRVACLEAFSVGGIMPTETGDVPANGVGVDGVAVDGVAIVTNYEVALPLANDCQIRLSVGRGTE